MKKMVIYCVIIIGILNSTYAGEKLPRVRGNGGQAHGCVTANTLITLGNNSTVKISFLTSNDTVLNKYLDEVEVFYTIQGPEKELMYMIKTDSDKTITATKGHPFYSKNGITAAKDFKVGNNILTIDGFERIKQITQIRYNGKVYNLAVSNIEATTVKNFEAIDPFLGLKSDQHTVILNGFISGDILIQRLLAK